MYDIIVCSRYEICPLVQIFFQSFRTQCVWTQWSEFYRGICVIACLRGFNLCVCTDGTQHTHARDILGVSALPIFDQCVFVIIIGHCLLV
jgi:hypothetical protein